VGFLIGERKTQDVEDRKMEKAAVVLVVVMLVAGFNANASIVVGGYSFDDNAFADKLVSATANWTYGGGASSLEEALVGSNPADYAFAFGSDENVVLSFTDNAVINLSGPDLAIFELGTIESFALSITVGGLTHTYNAVDTGYTAGGFNLLIAKIDLDDFFVPAGGTVNIVQLFPAPTNADPADFTVIAAMNNIPEPAALTLLALGAILAGRKRRA
jgi:hypothetical protein